MRYVSKRKFLEYVEAEMTPIEPGSTKQPSYCSTHDTYPAPEEPCWQCANPHIERAYTEGQQEVGRLITSIVQLEVDPPVFSVDIVRKDWQSFYTVQIAFRGSGTDMVSASASTVIEALKRASQLVLARHCPHCGALMKKD